MELEKVQEFLKRINNTKIKEIDMEKDADIVKGIIEDWENYESTSSNDTKVSEFYALRVFFINMYVKYMRTILVLNL